MNVLTQITGGVVKGGVIVPDVTLPEGARVEIMVPNAPPEIVERVRWGPSPAGASTSTTDTRTRLGPDVEEFLRYHQAEAAFASLLDVARASLPELVQIEARVEEDHDERGWFRVVVEVTAPAGHPLPLLSQQYKSFTEQLYRAVPSEQRMLFVVLTRVAPE